MKPSVTHVTRDVFVSSHSTPHFPQGNGAILGVFFFYKDLKWWEMGRERDREEKGTGRINEIKKIW